MEHTRQSSLRAYVPFFSSDAFSLLFLLNQSPFRHLILSKFALLQASRQEEAAPGRAGAGVLSRKRGRKKLLLFRRETEVEGVGTGLSFAAKTSCGPLGPRESPLNLLRVAGITWAGMIRKVYMLRLVVFFQK